MRDSSKVGRKAFIDYDKHLMLAGLNEPATDSQAATSWTGAALWNNKGGLGAETGWQDTKTTQAIIDYVKSLGFKSVRIPCPWAFGHISNASDYTIKVY